MAVALHGHHMHPVRIWPWVPRGTPLPAPWQTAPCALAPNTTQELVPTSTPHPKQGCDSLGLGKSQQRNAQDTWDSATRTACTISWGRWWLCPHLAVHQGKVHATVQPFGSQPTALIHPCPQHKAWSSSMARSALWAIWREPSNGEPPWAAKHTCTIRQSMQPLECPLQYGSDGL